MFLEGHNKHTLFIKPLKREKKEIFSSLNFIIIFNIDFSTVKIHNSQFYSHFWGHDIVHLFSKHSNPCLTTKVSSLDTNIRAKWSRKKNCFSNYYHRFGIRELFPFSTFFSFFFLSAIHSFSLFLISLIQQARTCLLQIKIYNLQ